MAEIPSFTSAQFYKALLKLGFLDKGGGSHFKLIHPTIKPSFPQGSNLPPFIVFPRTGLESDRNFQKALVRNLVRYWGISQKDILKALR